ncbi:MAG: hypothetical protein JXA22_05230 [Candidatus Thermoplasmatota archaeon]|nr:hypothetical protein [Candidatus Thermoplasmatota archaeon]
MTDPETPEENTLDDTLPDDIRIHKVSVPGGWIYISYVKRKIGGRYFTTQLSTVYVPGRR